MRSVKAIAEQYAREELGWPNATAVSWRENTNGEAVVRIDTHDGKSFCMSIVGETVVDDSLPSMLALLPA